MTFKTVLAVLFFLICVQLAFSQSTFIPKNLGGGINSSYDEINPVISSDRGTLFFTRIDHPGNSHGAKNTADVWCSQRQGDGSWAEAKQIPALNIWKYNTALSLTADGHQMLLYTDEGLSLATKNNDEWSTPRKINIKGSKDAMLSWDGKYLVFSKGGKLYISEKKEDGRWGEPLHAKGLKAKVSSPFLTADNKTLYFSGSRKGKQNDIFKTERTGAGWEEWSVPVALNDTINSLDQENYLKTNPNGAWGYFSSNHNATGKGDIFQVKLYEDNPFVVVTGKVVNAVTKRPLKNKNITMMVDGMRAEFFTVNRDSATYSVRLPFGKKYSVSASVDHYSPHSYDVDATSAREYTKTNIDIEEGPVAYALLKGKLLVKNTDKVIPATAKPKIVVDGEEIDSAYIDPVSGAYSLKIKHGNMYYVQVSARRFESFPEVVDLKAIDGYEEITLDLLADAEKMAIVTGKIIDKKAGKPVTNTLPIQVNVEGVSAVAASIDSLGNYELRVPLREKHTLSAAAHGYYPVYETIDVEQETNEVKISRDLMIVPIEKGQSVRLNNVFFEPGKTVLSEKSAPELGRLVSFLNANPHIRIEIGGHTDNSSKVSTLNMAKAVVNYLAAQGVAKNRMTARGYAATKPVASNKTPEGKAQNRRIEFTILEK